MSAFRSHAAEAGHRHERGLVASVASLATGRVAIAVLSYAATAAVARTLSESDWGGFTLIFSVATMLGAIFDLQATRLVLDEVLNPDLDAGRTMGSYMTLRLLLGVGAYAAAIAFVFLGDYSDSVRKAMVVGGVLLLLSPTWNALYVYFQAHRRLRTVAVVVIVSRVLLLLFTLLLVVRGNRSPLAFMWPWVVAEAFILSVLLLVAHRHVGVRLAFEPQRWKAWLKETIPIALGAAIGTMYFRIDAVMLSQLDALEAVGLYGIAYKFSDLLGFVPVAVMAPAFAELVRAWPSQPAMFQHNFRGALILLVITALPLVTAFCIFAEPLVVLLYGDRYGSAANAARLVIVGQGLRFFTILCTFTLVAVRRNVTYAAASVAGLGVNVALNLFLIPQYSYRGAAFTTVVTELGVLTILIGAVRRVPEVGPFPWLVVGRVTVATAAFAGTALLADAVLWWPVAALLAAGVLVALLHVLGVDGPGGLRTIPRLLEPVRDPQAAPSTEGPAGVIPT